MKRLLLTAALAACGDDVVDRPPPPPRGDAGVTRSVAAPDAASGLVGVIVSAESVDIAPRFQGVVIAVRVRTGDHVSIGQIIAEMDPKAMQEELRAAQAALGGAQAAKRQAEVDVEDAKRKAAIEDQAVASGVSARSVAEEAHLAVKRAEAAAQRAASVVAAETSHVQTARDHLSDNVLRATFEGTVANRYRDPGATIPAGSPIVRIVGRGGPRLRFAVPPERARLLVRGGRVTAKIDTIARVVTAVVQEVSPALDPASGMILVEATLEGDTAELRPGLAATVEPE